MRQVTLEEDDKRDRQKHRIEICKEIENGGEMGGQTRNLR